MQNWEILFVEVQQWHGIGILGKPNFPTLLLYLSNASFWAACQDSAPFFCSGSYFCVCVSFVHDCTCTETSSTWTNNGFVCCFRFLWNTEFIFNSDSAVDVLGFFIATKQVTGSGDSFRYMNDVRKGRKGQQALSLKSCKMASNAFHANGRLLHNTWWREKPCPGKVPTGSAAFALVKKSCSPHR